MMSGLGNWWAWRPSAEACYLDTIGKDTISLRGGKIRILSKPASSIIDVGILSDKPASESMQSPEIDAEEV